MPTRLEKTLYRLEAQSICFEWCFAQIQDSPGIIFELGLGLGRTWNHLNHHLPDRKIYAFDRQLNAYPDCTPAQDRLILGELSQTLPEACRRFGAQVVLAHCDLGSFDRGQNKATASMIGLALKPALAPSALVMSDLPLNIGGCEALTLPPGARADRYYLYQNQGAGSSRALS